MLNLIAILLFLSASVYSGACTACLRPNLAVESVLETKSNELMAVTKAAVSDSLSASSRKSSVIADPTESIRDLIPKGTSLDLTLDSVKGNDHVSKLAAKATLPQASKQAAKAASLLTYDSLKPGDLIISSQVHSNTPISFTLLKSLGSGEEGKVFSAVQSSNPSASPIALKFYLNGLSGDEQRLNHVLDRIPTISATSPQLLEPFKLPNSHTWVLPMKLYENVMDLQDAVRVHPFYSTAQGRQDLFLKAKQELESLFRRGYVYNDVNGKNFLVDIKHDLGDGSLLSKGSDVHLIDFGRVKSIDEYWSTGAARNALEEDIANLKDEIFNRFKI